MNIPDDILEINLKEVLGSEEAFSIQQLTLYIPNKDREGREIKNLRDWIKEAQKVLTIIGEVQPRCRRQMAPG